MEQTTTHQNEGEDNEGITRTKRAPREISMATVEKALQEGTPQGPPIATPTQEDVVYEEMLELAVQASIQDLGTPISLDDTLTSKLPGILIPNTKDSCYVVNGAIVLAATLQGQGLTSVQYLETGGPKSELLQIINARLLQPIQSTMTQDNPGKALHISESTIQDIRNKYQQWGWIHTDGEQCISEFLTFLWDAFGMTYHSIERIKQVPDRPDEISKEHMGTLHLAIPSSGKQSGNTLDPVELIHLIQETLSPEVNVHNNVTTTVKMQKISDTLIIHTERVISG
jgi:hypothetical protein